MLLSGLNFSKYVSRVNDTKVSPSTILFLSFSSSCAPDEEGERALVQLPSRLHGVFLLLAMPEAL